MNFSISLELGPFYEITYIDGSKIKFQVIGGPNAEARVIKDANTEVSAIPSILQNFKSVIRLDD